jgi:hypothetical protein
MQHGDYGERFFVRSISDHILSHGLKPQRPCGEVGTAMARMREGHEGTDRLVDFIAYAVGGVEIIRSYVFPRFR